MRIGHGYDAHRLGGDRPFVIGGVKIPYDRGIFTHSDGDTLAHAIIDAFFGAAGMRDIGAQYPDSAAAYDNADSMGLLRDAVLKINKDGFTLEYLDCTVIAQAPKMGPHITAIRENIARACGVEISRVNVKATTEEKMGFTGNGEGIAAHAVCLLNE